MAAQNIKLGNHLYYCSVGLKRAEKIKQGKLLTSPEKWDFENEYVKIKWIQKEDIDKYTLFLGMKQVRGKDERIYNVIRLIDPDSGELGEFFAGESANVVDGLSLLQPVVVEVTWSSGHKGTRFNMVSVRKDK